MGHPSLSLPATETSASALGTFAIGQPAWLLDLDQVHSSYYFVLALVALALVAGVLFQVGAIGWIWRVVEAVLGGCVRNGFLLWELLLSWASWPVFLAVILGFLVVGGAAGTWVPVLKVFCGLAPLLMGATACMAYMFIDLERYEVERGHKAVHNPLQGQGLASYLARHGQQVRVPLLIAATIAIVAGFALLNQGLYETVGQSWFQVEGGQGGPIYVDFLVYGLISLLGIVDVLNLAHSEHVLRAAYVHAAQWPASALLVGFRSFFTLVLVQQIFASLRQGTLLADTIADLWSPQAPIHDRARNALPQYGTMAIGPLLVSLRSVPTLTKEQRDQLPVILATIGPSTIPTLVRHLHDEHDHVRAIAAAALGRLHAVDAVPVLVALAQDPSELVRQGLVEALGILGSAALLPTWKKRDVGRAPGSRRRGLGWLFGRIKRGAASLPALHVDPVAQAVTTLTFALADSSAAVRTQAALALGRIGPPAVGAAPELIALLKEGDETGRCQAAEALGQISALGARESGAGSSDVAHSSPDPLLLTSPGNVAIAALVDLLQDASAPVKAAAARALGALKGGAATAVPALVPLLQDREESVRTAAAAAVAQIAQAGVLNGAAIATLVEGLASPDNVVRAQTAEALGTIAAPAAAAAPALVEAMADGNDWVRAKAAEALGKIGESAAAAAVPTLKRALRDQDNWVSALAAEALGHMGESADGAIPALVRSLKHLNPQVRGNAAAALGKMGAAAAGRRLALEKASADDDGGVRSQAIRALGTIGSPTPASEQVVLAGLQDLDPLVRAAAVESVGQWGDVKIADCGQRGANGPDRSAGPNPLYASHLMPLLEDANDQVKVEAIKAVPKLAGATPAVIDSLCRCLLEDDSAWVQVSAALALGQLGPAAVAAGGALLRATQTGEDSVREQAMRAIAMIQPPEILEAFAAGLQDANGDIRKVASGGWIRAGSIPEEAVPNLVVALRDPDVQVRANAAHALARLDSLPAEAIPLLVACAADPSDALRINAALALKEAPPKATGETMHHLVEDVNLRIRLIAASSLLLAEPGHAKAGAVLEAALNDPAPRLRTAALSLVDSLGKDGEAFLEILKQRRGLEEDEALLAVLTRVIEHLEEQARQETHPDAA